MASFSASVAPRSRKEDASSFPSPHSALATGTRPSNDDDDLLSSYRGGVDGLVLESTMTSEDMFLYLQRSAMVCPAGEDASQVTRGDDIACEVFTRGYFLMIKSARV